MGRVSRGARPSPRQTVGRAIPQPRLDRRAHAGGGRERRARRPRRRPRDRGHAGRHRRPRGRRHLPLAGRRRRRPLRCRARRPRTCASRRTGRPPSPSPPAASTRRRRSSRADILLTGDQQKLMDSAPVFSALDVVFSKVRARHRLLVGLAVPELPEVQAHAERLTDEFAGAELRNFRPITFTALKTAVPAPDAAYGEPLIASRPPGQVPPAALPDGDVRGPPDARRPPPRRHQAVGQTPRRPGAVLVRATGGPCCSPSRAPSGAAGVWCVPTADRADRAPARPARSGGDATSTPTNWRRASRPQHAPAHVPAQPALHRRHRPAPRQRGVPPRQALTRSR